ncbi:putative dehydrogenase [Salinibacter ruber]|uniref:Gfo/Idh/MocA family protein n=1 Tax=Salinibacter ruber TaxID=146919 RepID=UPI0021691CA6|nr:Gfo/Idh/MocA family oxidoreductase [Salinibacter ruber]MCS3862914.1 putative dehydrogenase [Salinibacter ruber]
MSDSMDRRSFLQTTAAAGLGVSLAPFSGFRQARDESVRLGLIGVGARGTSHLRGLIQRDDVKIPAVCDVKSENLNRALDLVQQSGRSRPEGYGEGDRAYRGLLSRSDLDGVLIATPWLWHVPMAVEAMEAGLFVGLEVPAATTVEGCWDLVHTAERTGSHCMFLENVCYRRDVMAVLKMVREGLFGEPIHCRCGYQHSLLPYLFDENTSFGPGTGSVSSWRTEHHTKRNGDLYTTHGIGPVAHWLDINSGNRFERLTSTATKARGLHDHIVEEGGTDHPKADTNFAKGDVVTSTITTANGESIVMTHDTSLPRPYSLGFRMQGTDGLWTVDNQSVHVEGRSPAHRWEDWEQYQNEFDADLWSRYEEAAEGSGHGGMDYFVRNALVESIKRDVAPPIDVYDAATWSVLSPLSERSIEQGGEPVAIPDFTDGRWMTDERSFDPDAEF